MKRLIVATSVAVVLTGCGTFGGKKNAQAEPIPSPTPAVTKDVTVSAQGKLDAPGTIDVPAWYIKAPASTEDYVFISGTGVSNDLSMSHQKALLDAQVKLADKINGVVNALMKQYKTDNNGTVGTDKTSLTVKKLIVDTAITGYHIEDSRVMSENRNYRTFVLIRYPMGDANRLLKDKRQQENQNVTSEDAAQDELERELKAKQRPKAAAPKADPDARAKPETVPDDKTSAVPVYDKMVTTELSDASGARLSLEQIQAIERQHGLVETKNMDLRQKRAQALLKPNSYVEHYTIR